MAFLLGKVLLVRATVSNFYKSRLLFCDSRGRVTLAVELVRFYYVWWKGGYRGCTKVADSPDWKGALLHESSLHGSVQSSKGSLGEGCAWKICPTWIFQLG